MASQQYDGAHCEIQLFLFYVVFVFGMSCNNYIVLTTLISHSGDLYLIEVFVSKWFEPPRLQAVYITNENEHSYMQPCHKVP